MSPRTQLKLEVRGSLGLGYFLFTLGAAAVVCGFLYSRVAVSIFGMLLALAALTVYLLLRGSCRQLLLRRVVRTRAFEDESVEVTIELENRSRLPIFFPRVCEIFSPEIHEQKDLILSDRLMPGETVRGRYTGYCILPRGVYRLGPTVLRVGDPLGWFEVRRDLTSAQELRVYPALRELSVRLTTSEALAQLLEATIQPRVGDREEAVSVREYRPGDSPRCMHWPLTAHHGAPMVREYAQPVLGDLHLIVDLHRLALVGAGRSSSLETALRIAVSLAAHALDRGRRVAFHGGHAALSEVPLDGGGAQLQRILETTVELRPRDVESYSSLVAERSAEVTAGNVVLLFVSPYLYGNRALEVVLRALVRRGVRVLVALFDEQSFRKILPSELLLSMDGALDRFEDAGVETYLVPCAADLEFIFAEDDL